MDSSMGSLQQHSNTPVVSPPTGTGTGGQNNGPSEHLEGGFAPFEGRHIGAALSVSNGTGLLGLGDPERRNQVQGFNNMPVCSMPGGNVGGSSLYSAVQHSVSHFLSNPSIQPMSLVDTSNVNTSQYGGQVGILASTATTSFDGSGSGGKVAVSVWRGNQQYSSQVLKKKPFVCVMCGEAFSRARHLQKHMEDAHDFREDDDEESEDDAGNTTQNNKMEQLNVRDIVAQAASVAQITYLSCEGDSEMPAENTVVSVDEASQTNTEAPSAVKSQETIYKMGNQKVNTESRKTEQVSLNEIAGKPELCPKNVVPVMSIASVPKQKRNVGKYNAKKQTQVNNISMSPPRRTSTRQASMRTKASDTKTYLCSVCDKQFTKLDVCVAHMKTMHKAAIVQQKISPKAAATCTKQVAEGLHRLTAPKTGRRRSVTKKTKSASGSSQSVNEANQPSVRRSQRKKQKTDLELSPPAEAVRRKPDDQTMQITATTRKGRRGHQKTLEAKIQDLLRANKETMELEREVTELIGKKPNAKANTNMKSRSNLRSADWSPGSDASLSDADHDDVEYSASDSEENEDVAESKVNDKTATSNQDDTGKRAGGRQVKIVKKFACSVCGEKFPSLEECVSHMKAVHVAANTGNAETNDVAPKVTTSLQGEVVKITEKDEDELYVSKTGRVRKRRQRKRLLRQDGWVVNKPTVFPCRYCDKVCSSEGGMRRHIAQDHCGQGEVKCHQCEQFNEPLSTKQLEEIANGVEQVRNMTDNKEFVRKKGTAYKVQYFECVACSDRYAVRLHYRKHQKTHRSVVCRFCDVNFPTVDALAKHIPSHNRGPLACRTCGQTFFTSYLLLMHMRGHTGNIKCHLCNATFMFQASLPRHMKQMHSGDKTIHSFKKDKRGHSLKNRAPGWTRQLNFTCEYCGNKHRTEATLKRHIDKFHSKLVSNPGQFICEVCGAIRRSAHSLRTHMVCHAEAIHKCDQCGRTFIREFSLKSHIERVHKGVRAFQCQYCGKNISSQASLLDHERLHTGEKPYECNICGKRFRLYQAHVNHRRREHTQEKPYKCDLCDKTFAVCQLMHKHKQTHNPVQQCVCHICGKTYSRSDLLKQHLVKHRQLSEFRCHECGRQFTRDIGLRYHMKKIHKIDLYRVSHSQVKPPPSLPPGQRTLETTPPVENQGMVYVNVNIPNTLNLDPNVPPQTMIDGNPVAIDVVGPTTTLPTPAMDVPMTQITYEPDTRLNDPTNLAITAILSQLCERT